MGQRAAGITWQLITSQGVDGRAAGKREGAMSKEITLGLIDNDPLSLVALKNLISQALPQIKLAWAVSEPLRAQQLALSASSARHPTILLTDMSMPGLDGIDLTKKIRLHDPSMWIIAMTSFPLEQYRDSVAHAGAQALVSKGQPATLLALLSQIATALSVSSTSTHEITAGVTLDPGFLPPRQAFERLARNSRARGIETFTEVENRIAWLCSEGYSTPEIQKELGVSNGTITTHIKRMCEKVGAKNRVQMVALWVKGQK